MANRQAFSRSSGLLILAAALLCVYANHSIAATTTFTGPWSGGTIAPNDSVVLNNGASVTGNVVVNGTLRFNQSAPSVLTISSTISGTGAFSLTNTGTLNVTGTSASANTVVLNLTTTASAGLLQVRSGSGVLWIGSDGAGTLNVAGGRVTNLEGYLGFSPGSRGTATISSGTWANSGYLHAGNSGTGTLNVSGGSVTSLAGFLGYNAGSRGTATISGGTWANSSNLLVGDGGTGTLNVTGGSVTNVTGYLGASVGGVGTATVSSGTWANSSHLYVGRSGSGTLNVSGGRVTSSIGYVGFQAGIVGTASVSSGTWANGGNLLVGDGGTGSLNVVGGRVANSIGYLGFQLGSVGTATVSGGTWANSGKLVVGVSGTGTLNVTGGSVTNLAGSLGDNYDGGFFSGVGTATVSGGTWANSGNLSVGVSGTGTLNVSGGTVTNFDGYVGRSNGGVGVGTASISSGTWANSGNLVIGNGGTGTLNVTGGSVTSSTGYLGDTFATTVGTATVSSGTWANSSFLYVGNRGKGTLNVTGGSVTNSFGYLGYFADSVGTATISSGTWTNSGFLYVGVSGTGTLNVTGGRIANVDGVLGTLAGSRGTATVSSGTWANSGNLSVGEYGTGALDVTGGRVANSIGYLGFQAGGVGTATVSSGTWANSGDLNVGVFGTGTLTMTGGLVTVGGALSRGTFGTINLSPGGMLQIGTGGTTGVLNTNLTNNGTLIFNRTDSSTSSVIIGGTGSIVHAGTGTTTLAGATSYSGPLAATAGRLIVGNSGSLAGFATVSSLAAGPNATLDLRSRGFAYVNGLSTLTGGTIRAANGISLGAGANVLGTGGVAGRVAAVYGSRIEADGGKLTVGDASSYAGFSSDGELYTNANEVELLDRNVVVLGSLTQLGTDSTGGSLRAANGMLLEQGKNLVGRGTVYGDFVNQGDVYGDGPAAGQQIIFAAGLTVSGIGSFTNAVFNGTYAPGNSPAMTNLTNGAFGSTSTLVIEIGGTQAGAQYDQVQNAGTLSLLGGTLNVVLTNSFVPAPGSTFTILRFGDVSGDFGASVFPAFDNGLGWQRLTTGTAMRVEATPSAVTIDVPFGSKTLASSGYSSLLYATSLDKSGTGTLVLDGTTLLAGPTSIQQGSIRVDHATALFTSTVSPGLGGTLSLAANLQTTVGGLNPNAGGLVDVGNGMITVASGLSATNLMAALVSGLGDGSWNGTSGITSSMAAASGGDRTVGWLDIGDGTMTFAFAAAGDTNLDWQVDIIDAANFLAGGKFDTGLPASWNDGDFTYDGMLDILDAANFLSNGLFDAGVYNAPTGAIAPVPEPSEVALVGIGLGVAAALVARRNRVA